MSMDDVLSMLADMKLAMAEDKKEMSDRLGALESEKTGEAAESTERETKPMMLENVMVAAGREKTLTKMFGVDTSATALLEFLDHYTLCRDMNRAKKVPGWEDPRYRAKELRFQLQGEVAVYVRQEEAMHQVWVDDDEEIIKKLKDRWLNRDCIELDIIEFEEARQGEYETLAQFMQRLKGLGQRAFSEFDPVGMHQRIIWRFLDGVREKEIRAAIIRERWMKDRTTPKPYDEVLKIAENAKLIRIAAGATGNSGSGSSKANAIQVGVVSSGRDRGGRRGRGAGPRTQRSFDCYYCHQQHQGGWLSCEKRRREAPDWEPSRSGGTSNSRRGSSSTQGSSGGSGPMSPELSNSGQSFR